MQILVIKCLSYNFPILDCFWTLGPLGLGSHLGLSNICYWFCINLGFFLMALGPLGSQPLALKALSPWMEYIVCFLRTLCILGLWTLDLWTFGHLGHFCQFCFPWLWTIWPLGTQAFWAFWYFLIKRTKMWLHIVNLIDWVKCPHFMMYLPVSKSFNCKIIQRQDNY